MAEDVLSYLQAKGLRLRRASGSEVNVPCFFHNEDDGERGRLYINVDPAASIPGLFHCKVCDERGSLVSIKRHFGDNDKVSPLDDSSNERRIILAAAAAYYHERLGENEEALGWLRGPERCLELDTIVDFQLGYADGGLYRHLKDQGHKSTDIIKTGLVIEARQDRRLVDSLSGMVTIPYFVAGNCVSIRGRAFPYDGKGPKYKTCGGNESRLFNSEATWHAEELCVAEGEFDAMVLGQLGLAAVGVPGANTWQDPWDGYVSDTRRLWLMFDGDAAGEQGAEKLIARFGPKAKRVLLPDGADVTTFISEGHTAAELQAAMNDAARGGLLITVDEAIEEFLGVQGQDGIKFGVELLDLMLEPGLLPAQVLILLAKSGVGKTLWLLNTMHRMAMYPGQEDLRFLFLSLEQTRGEWWDRARRIHRFYDVDSTEEEAARFWRDRLLLTDKNRLSEMEIVSALDDFDYRMGGQPDVIFLDYLGYWAQSFKGERYERVSDAVMNLKALAKDRRIPIITPHQISRATKYGEEPDADSARDAGVIEETADFVFTLWADDTALGKTEEEKTGLVKLRIGKSRHGGRGVRLNYQFAPISLTLVPHQQDTHKLQRMARDELEFQTTWRDRWPQAVYRHRTGFRGAMKGTPGYQEQM